MLGAANSLQHIVYSKGHRLLILLYQEEMEVCFLKMATKLSEKQI
jgi:hypothetical protein